MRVGGATAILKEGMIFLLEWWNFMFAAPLVAGVVFAVVVVVTGLGGEGGHDAHADSGDFVLAGTDGHAHGPDGDDGDGHTDVEGQQGGFDLLGWFGIGRGVSLSVMLPVLLTGWGLCGLVLNQLFAPVLRVPNIYAPVAALGALLGAAFIARNFARAFNRLSDTNRKTSVKEGGLVGCRGTTVFEVTSDEGAANIRDPFGNIHRVSARTRGESIAANTGVTVLEYRGGVYVIAQQ
jgi:membrane protein implicated in regulation of membrane protease activity